MADQRYIPDVCSRIDFHVGLLQAGAGNERPMKVIKDGNRPARDHLPKLRMLPRGKRTQQPHARPFRRVPRRLSIKPGGVSPEGWATAASWRRTKSADRTRNEEHGNSSKNRATKGVLEDSGGVSANPSGRLPAQPLAQKQQQSVVLFSSGAALEETRHE